jgi:hypothetical protein
MAWRWEEAKRTQAFLDDVQVYMRDNPRATFNSAVSTVFTEKGRQYEHTQGYCGLAGQEGL